MTGADMTHGLPYDMWQQILEYLPAQEKTRAISINRTTYDIVLNAVYRDVHWGHFDVDMVKSLMCLSNASIAARVRKLHVQAWFIHCMIYDKEKVVLGNTQNPSRLSRICRHWVRGLLRRGGSKLPLFFTAFRLEVEVYKAQLISGKVKHVVKKMQAAVANMSSLNECVLETRCLPPRVAAPFFSTLSTVIANNLRKLAVQCSVAELAELTTAGLQGLEELSVALEFQVYDSMDGLARDQEYLVAGLATLVNKLAPSLSAFHLASYTRLDLSPFFNALGVLPSLHQLSLHISLASDLLSDPTALLHFLCKQSQQLRIVELLPQFYELGLHIWGDFFTRVALEERALSGLNELKIFYPIDLGIVEALMSRSKETLRRLHLHRRLLSFPEIKRLTLVSPRLYISLTTLHLEVHVLCPAIFDFLSRNVLTLQSLNLVYQTVGGTYLSSNGDEYEHGAHAADDSTDFFASLRIREGFDCPFICAMKRGHYEDWGLCDIGIWEYQVKRDDSYHINDLRYMAAVARAAPRVTTMRGHGIPDYAYHYI